MKKFLSLCLLLSLMSCGQAVPRDHKYQYEVYNDCIKFVQSKPDLNEHYSFTYYHELCLNIAAAKAVKK